MRVPTPRARRTFWAPFCCPYWRVIGGTRIFPIWKTACLWDRWVEECPVTYESPNAPGKADVLGTILLSVLAGHRRYAHITALRFDGVNPNCWGWRRSVARIRCGARLVG